MNTQNFEIDDIPAVLWGDASDKLYLYVHGKHACKEHAFMAPKDAEIVTAWLEKQV